jgi:hypothetical protein
MEMKVKPEDFDALCYFNNLLDRGLAEIISEDKTKVDIGRWLKSTNASKTVAEDTEETLVRTRSELQVAVDDPKSDQREGYSYLSKPKLNRYHKFICDAHDDATKYIDTKYPKKIRRKKPVDPAKAVKNLKYKEKDDDFGLTSIPSRDILGADIITVFNTKTRTLTVYHAKEGGLGVKGSTILNFSEKSQAKRLRKPKETLVHFVSVGFALVQRKFDDIRAKPSMPNGRMNPHTVLLWGHKKMSK